MNKIIIIAVVAALIVGGGAFVFFSGIFSSKQKEEKKVESKKPEENIKLEEISFVQLPEVIINLKGSGILKAILILEINNIKDKEKIDHLKPLIVDQCQTYLRELEASDLQGSAGLERVRQELKNRLSNLLSPVQVRQVLYKDFLIQ